MADLEQWVNLTRHTKWFGDGLTEVERTTESVKVTIQFDERSRATGLLSVTPGSDNVTYTATEIPRRNATFTLPNFTDRQFQTDETGKYEVDINVGPAGGNEFTISVKDADGNELKSDLIKTRRKLYLQIIKMSGVSEPAASDVTAMKDEYWNESKRIFLKIVEYASGQTIPSSINLDHNTSSAVQTLRSQARAVYDNSKAPNAFVAVMVKKIGPSELESGSVAKDIRSAQSSSSPVTFNTTKTFMSVVDPARNNNLVLIWIPSEGVPQIILSGKITFEGNNTIKIDPTGLTPGTGPGRFIYSIMVCSGALAGLSYPTINFTVTGTRWAESNDPFSADIIRRALIHEMGHKIGMVPGTQSDRVLDVQSSQFSGRGFAGNHCSTGLTTPLPAPPALLSDAPGSASCMMWGQTVADHYCSACLGSLRKLDLRGSSNTGLRNQF